MKTKSGVVLIGLVVLLSSSLLQARLKELKCARMLARNLILENIYPGRTTSVFHVRYGFGYATKGEIEGQIDFNQNSLNGHSVANVPTKEIALELPHGGYQSPFEGFVANTPVMIKNQKYRIYGMFEDGSLLALSDNKTKKMAPAQAWKEVMKLSPKNLTRGDKVTVDFENGVKKEAKVLEVLGLAAKISYWGNGNSANAPRQFEERLKSKWVPLSILTQAID